MTSIFYFIKIFVTLLVMSVTIHTHYHLSSTDNYPHSDKNTPNSDPHTHYQSGSR